LKLCITHFELKACNFYLNCQGSPESIRTAVGQQQRMKLSSAREFTRARNFRRRGQRWTTRDKRRSSKVRDHLLLSSV